MSENIDFHEPPAVKYLNCSKLVLGNHHEGSGSIEIVSSNPSAAPIAINGHIISGGGGSSSSTTSDISSENYPGQTLENEIDIMTSNIANNSSSISTNTTDIATNVSAITTAMGIITSQTTSISVNSGNIATNQGNITTNTGAIATNTGNITSLTTQQTTNTGAIATNTGNINSLTTQQTTNTGAIATNTGNITSLTTQQTTNTGAIATNTGNITSLTTQQTTNTGAIATNTGNISSLTTQQTTNTGAIATNTGNISTITANLSNKADKNANNDFSGAGLGVATLNNFDGISVSSVANAGQNDAISYKQGGNLLNFSHLAGTVSDSMLDSGSVLVKTNNAIQTVRPSTGSETKLSIENSDSGGSSFSNLVVQKNDSSNSVENALTIKATPTGTEITASGNVITSASANLSITPASGLLAMTLGSTFTRVHNTLQILGSMQGAARGDAKSYIFSTDGLGQGFSVLNEDLLMRPGASSTPSAGSNPSASAVVKFDSSGVPTYELMSNFVVKPGGANPSTSSLILVDPLGSQTYQDVSVVLAKPLGQNPTNNSFVQVDSSGNQSYISNVFAPLPFGALPTSGEQGIFWNPGGSSYVNKSEFLFTNVANQTINATATANAVTIQSDSATNSHDVSLKILRSFGGVESNSMEIVPLPASFCEMRVKNDLDIHINNASKLKIGNHDVQCMTAFKFQGDMRLKENLTIPSSATDTGAIGTVRFDTTHLYVAVGVNTWRRVALSTF